MIFQCINIRQVPWGVLKTASFGLGFQHLPRDLANVNAWKNMFDPYIGDAAAEEHKILQMEFNCLTKSELVFKWKMYHKEFDEKQKAIEEKNWHSLPWLATVFHLTTLV